MMRNLLLLLIFSCIGFALNAQKSTFSGYIKDADTGEELIGAQIYIEELKTGGVTNIYGFYSLTINKGTYNIVISYLGYESERREINLDNKLKENFNIRKKSTEIEEVVIKGERKDANIKSVEMSVIKLPIEQIQTMPALMGEVDIIKSIQLLPGIQSSGEGSSGFHVRGGGADQNLVLLDDATVYSSSHLFGFFSVFNHDAVKDVKIFKGGIPSKYGGRLSSLLDIRMKEGNSKKFTATGGIGLVSSRLTLEAPIVKDKVAFIASGRRTYIDMFFPMMKNEGLKDTKIYFWDLNAKVNYKINDKNRIYLSGYFGKDVMSFSNMFRNDYGNKTLTLRYNHLFSDKVFSNFTLLYSDYEYVLGVPKGPEAWEWISNIRDLSAVNDYTWYITPNNTLNFGLGLIYHRFKPGEIKADDQDYFENYIIPWNYAYDYYGFIENELKIGDRVSLRYGVRYSVFQNAGKSTFYEFDKSDYKDYEVTDTLKHNRGVINTYKGFEPRMNINVEINDKSSIKANYNRTIQYMQLASNTASPMPYDFWFPSSKNIKPQKADQVALGYFRNFLDNIFETSLEVYYKKTYDVIDFKDHAQLLLNKHLEGEIRSGNAYSYGAELMVKKQIGKLTGWVSYTYSKTRMKIPEINDGFEYDASYDHPHDISIVLSYNITKRLNISANWIYSTGAPRTMPTGRYTQGPEQTFVPIYSDRNAVRLPDFHRGDLSMTLNMKKKRRNGKTKRIQSSLNISVYNFYNRHNAYTILFRQDENNSNITYSEKMYLLPIFPSITYNFIFK